MKKKKRTGVYDRWLFALGGGEQLAFSFAESLRDLGYKTDLITHKKIDIESLKEKMEVDLTGINIRYIPNLPDYQLSGYTEEYDVFVSNSYLDYIPNRSKFGILSIFFPSRINLSLYEYLKRAHRGPSLRKFFIYPSSYEGFRFDQYFNRTMHKWLGQESKITFNENINQLRIELYFVYFTFSCIDRIVFLLDSEKIHPVKREVNIIQNTVIYTFSFKKSIKNKPFTIRLPETEYYEIALTKIIIPSLRYFAYNIFKQFFSKMEMRLHGGPSVTRFSDIESYDRILAISQFSKLWVKKYWGLNSDILYPAASIEKFQPARFKKNMIVNIGRFFITGHCKKQLDLVRVFKKIVDSGYKNWELHFIGSVAEGETHQQYYEKVAEESVGYPVFFHINAPFNQLKSILSQAKIYWHATGLDEDPNRNPIRLEHFGITTIEAMASGCVPVVINAGGQTEIVTEKSGYLWNTRGELIEYTKKLMRTPKLLKEKREGAIERSKFFSKENFKKKLQEYLPKN